MKYTGEEVLQATLTVETVSVKYMEKDVSCFKVSEWFTYSSNTVRSVLDAYVDYIFTLKSDRSFPTYSTHTVI